MFDVCIIEDQKIAKYYFLLVDFDLFTYKYRCYKPFVDGIPALKCEQHAYLTFLLS